MTQKRSDETPSEVFVTMSSDGIPRDVFLTFEQAKKQVASFKYGTRYERIERFVLAPKSETE